MEHDMSFISLFLQATLTVKIVMIVLMGASVFSWSIILFKIYQFSHIKKELSQMEMILKSDFQVFYNKLMKSKKEKNNLENVFMIGFQNLFKLVKGDNVPFDFIEKSLENTQETMYLEIEKIEKRLKDKISNLATIGSVSPYIGLFGTVIGIMNSFIALSALKQATIDLVAPGIAEALIATAIGLAAAIPAYIANNKLSEVSKSFTDEYYYFADSVVNNLKNRLLASKRESQ